MDESRSILIVEDNEDDVMLIRRALRKGGIDAPFVLARNGDEAVTYFSSAGQDQDAPMNPLPTVVLLDLRLPGKSGLEVLEWLKSHERFALLPVIVFTNSVEETDVRQAYALGANSYLKKPYTSAATMELLKIVTAYWLDHNVRPPVF